MPTYHDLDGSVCSEARAVELFKDSAVRTAAQTRMYFEGFSVLVSTVFTIVDQLPELHPPGEPMLWVTEVIGGPPDIDGTFQFAPSREAAIEHHALMVERMTASGCLM